MVIKSSKQREPQQVQFVLKGGLNYAQTPITLKDDEMRIGTNFIYDPDTEFPITRPGTSCKTLLKCDGVSPIIALYYYEKTVSVAYLVAACNGNLYRLSGASLDAWTLIGVLNDTTTVPSFLTFNSKLLIADGGSAIRLWDGTTYSTISDSPAASALSTIKNRVVANHVGELDSVYMSSPKDAETPYSAPSTGAWNTAGTAIGLKAGYGDTLAVNGFGMLGDDLIVFKKGDTAKRIYRVNVSDATPANWYVADLSENNCAQNHQSIVNAWNNVFFVDTNGFKSIKGVDVYGDLQIDATGRRINTVLTSQSTCDFMQYIPSYNAIWMGLGQRIYCYTERMEEGKVIPAFTDLTFKQGRIRDVCQAGSYVYLAGHDGFLYRMNEGIATDATSASTSVAFTSTIRTKTLAYGGDMVLRKLQWYLRPKIDGAAVIKAYTDDETSVALKTITLRNAGVYVYDATGYLADANEFLYDEGSPTWVETARGRVRNIQMAFELLVTSGRVGVEWVRAEVALLEGGE